MPTWSRPSKVDGRRLRLPQTQRLLEKSFLGRINMMYRMGELPQGGTGYTKGESREFLSGLAFAFIWQLIDFAVATGRRIQATASMGGTGYGQIGRVGGLADW